LPSLAGDGSLRKMRPKVFDLNSRPGARCSAKRQPSGPASWQRSWQRLRRSAVVSAALALVLVPISGSAGLGCDTSCDDGGDKSDPAVVYEGGSTDDALSYYESDSWDGPYLKFPPQRTYDFHHGLGRRPYAVLSYVGFSESPLRDGNGNISEAAGNEVIIEWVDEQVVRVRNDTCETFYLRLVALAGDQADTASGGAAN
jgi:hypothetical protein